MAKKAIEEPVFGYKENCVKSRTKYNGKVVKLKVDEITTVKGEPATREYVKHNGGVCILAINKQGKIAIIQQYRYPVTADVLELPAGKLEEGEEPLQAAKRELEEEIGYVAKEMTSYGAIYPCVGYSSEVIHLYVATNLKKTKTHFDADEYIECKWFSEEEIKYMLNNNFFKDAKTLVLLYRYFNRDVD